MDAYVDANTSGLRWLSRLRWWALAGTLGAIALAWLLDWQFVHVPAVAGGVVVMALVNVALVARAKRAREVSWRELGLHAAVDLVFLSWLLAWTGGLSNPVSVAFSFHVVLGALLNGRRGAISATTLSLACIALLWTLDERHWLPQPELVTVPRTLILLALGLLVVGLGYLALVVAERHVAERREAERGVTLLLDSLAALKVGLDLVGPDGKSQLANETARDLQRHPPAQEAARALETNEEAGPVSRRFAVPVRDALDHRERIIDLVALPQSRAIGARALLYVDRTDELLVEQRHVMLERLATLGRALQGVAHELNTPLTTMQTLAKDLRAALKDAALDERLRKDVDESLQLLVEESQRCRTLTQSLLSSANDGRRPGTVAQRAVDVVRRAVRLVGAAEVDEVSLDPSLDVVIPVDADRVLQVVMNLVQNALRATADLKADGRGPRVVVKARRAHGALLIQIADRGPGLPAEVRARLFEPFVTTRPMGEGTGLGLYTSQLIARELGGSLVIDDAPSGGTLATLTLPAPELPDRPLASKRPDGRSAQGEG
ncbi:MAG: HAMP domain-containing histidine kinase [Deltaproteobacteria bacterium]|nr:HAMP domain-containing histidine kinase [Deltaproteobacteria bacterium]